MLIASPSGLSAERDAVQRVLDEWNSTRGHEMQRVFVPLRWEYGDHTGFSEDGPQGILNEELVSRADFVVAMIWQKLGTPTRDFRSGTLEEIERAMARGIPVHILFKTADVSIHTNPEDLRGVHDYQRSLKERALYSEFVTLADLERRVHWILDRESRPRSTENRSAAIGPSESASAGDVSVIPGATVESAGHGFSPPVKVMWRSQGDRLGALIITNCSIYEIESLRVQLSSDGDGLPPSLITEVRTGPLQPAETWRPLALLPGHHASRFIVIVSGVTVGKEFSNRFEISLQ